MNQNLFVNFFDNPNLNYYPVNDESALGAGANCSANHVSDAPSDSAKRIHSEILEHRLAEMESREEILDHLRAIHRDRLWRTLGYKSLQAFCKKDLGYPAREARDIAISLGAIIVSKSLKSDDPETQQRIDALREWRKRTSTDENVAAYRLFANRTLLQLAHSNPQSIPELKEISGLGVKRIEAFGADLLRVLRSAHLVTSHQPSLPSEDA